LELIQEFLQVPTCLLEEFKQSGIGREGAKYGMEEYLELKTLSFGNIK
jgi:acyl-CoA reductase-like NAD-dependent aldehyde dehydrogenase